MSIESEHDRLEALKSLGSVFQTNNQQLFGIFEAPYVSGDLADLLETNQPTILTRESDAASLTRGTVIQHDGKPYRLESKQPDGTGMVRLILSED